MDPTTMTTLQKVLVAGGLGLIIGLVPLITGIIKRNFKYGLIGFFGSIIGGAIFGLILALPIATVCTWLIVRGPKPSADSLSSSDNSNTPRS